jgi:uncharacterized protein (TIGR03437 family)
LINLKGITIVKYTKDYHAHLKIASFILAVVALSLSLSSPQASAQASALQAREVRVVSASAVAGQSVSVSVELVSLGNENAIGFSLNFNQAILSNPVVTLGAGGAGASLNPNLLQAGSGLLGIALAYPSNGTFTAGPQQLVSISFTVASSAPAGPTPITFGNQPIVSEISDVSANSLTATYTPGAVTVAQPNPSPMLVALNPSSTSAGGGGFTLTVNGLNFVSGSVVRWNGSPRNTNFVTASQLTSLISANDIASAGTASISVLNPAPGGGISNSLTFTINNPTPAITSVTPDSANAGSGAVTVTVNGTGFTSASKVRFNSNELTTTFVSATQLTATIPASSLTTAGAANITVLNPTPGGGTSNATPFTVNNPAPTVAGLNPSSATAGGAAFTLTVNGTGFVNGSAVRWNGANRTTAFVSATQLTAAITAADIATAGAASVTVVNSAPGGGTSNAVNFPINQPNPAPGITSLNPSFANIGGQSFPLIVNGTNFTNSSVVRWNDSDRTTMFVSATQLRATIPASDIAAAGTANIRVFTPAPGGGTTNALPFIVAARVTSVSAASFLGDELAAESIIAGFGLSLATRVEVATVLPLPTDLAGTKVMVKDSAGIERLAPQFFVSPGQANFQMPPGTANGTATVTVTSGDNKLSIGAAQVTSVAPGVFAANANGQGVMAATILRVKPDNSQIFEPVVRFDSATGRFVSVPIDLGPETDQVFLVMFGTGIRLRSALSAVNVKIGGTDVEVLYASVAPGFIGLDQINVRLTRSFIGRGEVDVVMMVEGKMANRTILNFR